MKILRSALLFSVLLISINAMASERTYGLHLFFDEKEFVDVLVLERGLCGMMFGRMIVPDDFEGPISKGHSMNLALTFELLVPKNDSRPKDLIFEYVGTFFDISQKQITGYVRIKGEPKFVGSFVAFEREKE